MLNVRASALPTLASSGKPINRRLASRAAKTTVLLSGGLAHKLPPVDLAPPLGDKPNDNSRGCPDRTPRNCPKNRVYELASPHPQTAQHLACATSTVETTRTRNRHPTWSVAPYRRERFPQANSTATAQPDRCAHSVLQSALHRLPLRTRFHARCSIAARHRPRFID